ncbi:MAG: YdcF family protein [Sediminibacterium sp.]|nr:YdcF family protein [Sediminibacterium sp.]
MKKISRHIIFSFLLCIGYTAMSQMDHRAFDPGYRFVSSGNPVQDKNFYLLTLLQADLTLFSSLSTAIIPELGIKSPSCLQSNECYIAEMMWTNEKNEKVFRALDALYIKSKKLKALINEHMRPSGYFQLYEKFSDTALLHAGWRDAAAGINQILAAYAFGNGLRYPKIDSSTYDAKSKYYKDLLQEIIHQGLALSVSGHQLFFQPSLDLALFLLEINNRDEAARLEPLFHTNAAAYNKVAKINWTDFPYSSILVLGEGPEFYNIPISPYGKLRCNMAAELYRKRQAPFIIVSGGYVHPFQTKFCEAVGMKDYLVNVCRIPSDRIIIDPHARHTTTNLRNTNRIIFRAGIPTDKRVLCVSSRSHIDYVFNERFSVRCLAEVAHVPYREIVRVNAFQFSYYPLGVSLQMNSADPLDP